LTGLEDVIPPAQQPRIGVSLSSPYPSPLSGQITLGFISTADVPSDDPAIQFATGGRVVDFSIPTNETQGQFPGGAPDVAFSTGTVAGSVKLDVVLKSGSEVVTPDPDPSRTVTVERLAPTITAVSVGSKTATGFEISVTGYSTTRSLSQAAFQFVAKPGSAVQGGTVTLDVGTVFTTWFEGTDSNQFGGQFRLVVPFTVQGDVNAIGSVSVTLTNIIGASAAASTNF